MKIIFESTGTTAGFENWLKAFKEINDSLLVEVDTLNQKFVSKTFTTDKTIVKYGHLSFEDAGLQVVNVVDKDGNTLTLDEWNATNGATRVKIGIFQVLSRFIKVVNTYSGTDNYKITVDFDTNGTDFVGLKVTFKSLALEMMFTCSDIDDFIYIDDEKFLNGIAHVENPIEFEVCADANKFLLDISGIVSVDQKKDIIEFSTKQNDSNEWTLHAVDRIGGAYDYTVAYLSAEAQCNPLEVVLPVSRNNFILATKSDASNTVISVAGEEGSGKLKIVSKNFVTIIAAVRV